MKISRMRWGQVCVALCAPLAAVAATKTTTFTVTATVINECTIGAAALTFAQNLGIIDTNVDATSTITLTCTSGTNYQIGLDAGTGLDSTITNRQLSSGTTNKLAYQLYRDPTRMALWGNATPDWATGTGTGSAQTLTVYGRIPPQSTPPQGTYTSVVTVTINY